MSSDDDNVMQTAYTGFKSSFSIFYPKMSEEKDRLATFEAGWPPQISPRPRRLAQWGFYYTQFGDKVLCYNCGLIIWNLTKNGQQKIQEFHQKAQPRCEMAYRC